MENVLPAVETRSSSFRYSKNDDELVASSTVNGDVAAIDVARVARGCVSAMVIVLVTVMVVVPVEVELVVVGVSLPLTEADHVANSRNRLCLEVGEIGAAYDRTGRNKVGGQSSRENNEGEE